MIRVGVVGFGTIGSRVAWAVARQPDMTLVGAVKRTPDFRARIWSGEVDFYAVDKENLRAWESSGVRVVGTMEDLLEGVDVIVDATPAGMGERNSRIYKRAGIKAIFQGGERPEVAEVSFVAQVNYGEAVGKDGVRVVSCNTTALSRIINLLNRSYGVEEAYAVIVRRAADPGEVRKGPIDASVLDPPSIPSHHAEDLRTVLGDVRVETAAVKVPTTHGHLHALRIRLKREAYRRDVVEDLLGERRIALVSSREGINSTSHLLELGRELGRPRGDIYEVVVWEDSVTVRGRDLFLWAGVHQEAIVVPENVDAIRALASEVDAERSMDATDSTLGIVRGWLTRTPG
ncbi:MAG: type II glyceraldehyde-3-phosphate dehydrogenase [Thermoproteota archaeon]|nr:MAG: type II glyceraldehyde-3-phosphate dehydrogenase [Candidatus Korarchaeota archaeon]